MLLVTCILELLRDVFQSNVSFTNLILEVCKNHFVYDRLPLFSEVLSFLSFYF